MYGKIILSKFLKLLSDASIYLHTSQGFRTGGHSTNVAL